MMIFIFSLWLISFFTSSNALLTPVSFVSSTKFEWRDNHLVQNASQRRGGGETALALFGKFFKRAATECEGDSDNANSSINSNERKTTSLNEAKWSKERLQKCSKLWVLDSEEQSALHNLGKRLIDIKHEKNDPYEVIRFYKEHNGDIQNTEKSFRKMIEWRIENNIDSLLEEYCPPHLFRFYPAAIMKDSDKDGDPILIERTGAADSRGLLNHYGRDEMLLHSTWSREIQGSGRWREAYESSRGQPLKQFTVILDMKGLSRKNMTPSLFALGQTVSRLTQENYPQFCKRIIFIRCPPLFKFGWTIFQPFIDKSSKDVMLFSTEDDYRDVLAKYVDLHILPSIISPEGKGRSVKEFDSIIWEGGSLPSEAELQTQPGNDPELCWNY